MPFEWSNYTGNDDTPSLPVFISERTQSMLLSALEDMDNRSNWSELDDTTWDDVHEAIANAYAEILELVMSDFSPVGSIIAFPSLTPPSKYVLCDGQSLSKTVYAELFAIIGNKYGSTSTHFNVPNLTDKFIYGQRLVGGNLGIDNTGGLQRVTLDVSEIPAHTHVQNGRNTPAGGVNQSAVSVNVASTAGVATSTVTGSTGGSGSHENMPPYHSLAWMVKALP